MATSKSKKEGQLNALVSQFETAKGVAFVKFAGATVNEVQVIRRELRANGMQYTVIKKTLMALAAKNTKLADFSANDLDGIVAVITSDSDEIAPAAAIKKMKNDSFDKETKTSKFDFSGAVFEGKLLDEKATAILADTPSREDSFAKIIAMLQSGTTKLHGVLNSGLQRPYNVLQNADKFAKA